MEAPDIKAFDEIKSERLTPNRVKPNSAQQNAWDETRTALLWHAPSFSHILYQMMSTPDGSTVYWTDSVPIAATDDKQIFLNPETYCKYSMEERVFGAAHEIMHAILNHCGQMHMHQKRGKITYQDGTSIPFDNDTYQIAMDMVINDVLVKSDIGKINKDWYHDPSLVSGDDAVADAYRTLYKDQDKKGGKGGSTFKGKSFDQHLAPGTGTGENPTQAQQDRNQAEWKIAINAAASAARVRGKMPGALDRFFKRLLEPTVSWQEHIRSLFARKVGNSAFSWATLDPQLAVRGIGAPGRMGYGANKIVVAVDTSGSISQQMMDHFMTEVGSIIDDVHPRQLYLMQCDARVQEVRECSDSGDLKGAKLKGGGGTDFRPVFEKIEEEIGEPDCLVYLTDGFGCWPDKKPSYPVIWGDITPAQHRVRYPFGDVVAVNMPQSVS
jgi:predicted metal-dependent peptidase